jgi:hypothetical protein
MKEDDEDIIIIHLGRELKDEELQLVADSIAAFMSKRFPFLTNSTLNIS